MLASRNLVFPKLIPLESKCTIKEKEDILANGRVGFNLVLENTNILTARAIRVNGYPEKCTVLVSSSGHQTSEQNIKEDSNMDKYVQIK